MRNYDLKYLPTLGPYAYAMCYILDYAEKYREDRLTPGRDIKVDENNLGEYKGCFTLFRGA